MKKLLTSILMGCTLLFSMACEDSGGSDNTAMLLMLTGGGGSAANSVIDIEFVRISTRIVEFKLTNTSNVPQIVNVSGTLLGGIGSVAACGYGDTIKTIVPMPMEIPAYQSRFFKRFEVGKSEPAETYYDIAPRDDADPYPDSRKTEYDIEIELGDKTIYTFTMEREYDCSWLAP